MRIKLKHVKRFRAKGRIYHYHRLTGRRLTSIPGTPEFVAEVERETAKAEKKAVELRGSLGALIEAYRGSPEFLGLAPRSRRDYLSILDWLKTRAGDVPLHVIDTPFVMGLRDMAYKGKKRRFANYMLQVLSLVFNWGIPRGIVGVNPAAAAEKIRRPRGLRPANRAWSSQELATVMDAASDDLRVAMALGAYAAMREGDVISLTWDAYDGTAIKTFQSKTGDPIWVPAHRELRRILDGWKQKRSAAPVAFPNVVVGARGRPYVGTTGFRANFFKLLRKLKAEGKVTAGLTFHGLRHTAATMLADAGCDDRDIMAVTGHKSAAMVRTYTEGADRRRRAARAIGALEQAENRDCLTEVSNAPTAQTGNSRKGARNQ